MNRLLLLWLLCASVPAWTQAFNTQTLSIKKASSAIRLDGELNDPAWAEAKAYGGFWKKYPVDDGPASYGTSVRMLYNDAFLYIAFSVTDSGKRFVTSLHRDVGHDANDGVAVMLDPLGEKAAGYFFVLNAYNTQSEGQIGPQIEGADFSWDNKWYTATHRTDSGWTAEMAIPFKTLRYNAEKKEWGINFLRVDMQHNQYSVWNRVPVNFKSYDLGYTGRLIWETPPPAPGSNIVFIPYAISQVTANREQNVPAKATANAGFDAKLALSSSMNLDLTMNPDFAQVEVDKQVTNLTRYSIFFPERRNFFLENADLFSTYGIPPIRPFYSRRIGLDKYGNRIPILAGARLSGNLTKTTRLGILNMQTGRKGDYSPENFTAISVNQKIVGRTFVKAYFLNREGFLTSAQKAADPLSAYGRNAGGEFNYSDNEGRWTAWLGYHHSYKPGITRDNNYLDGGAEYNVRNFQAVVDAHSLGTQYFADMGYLERIENYDALRDTAIRLGYRALYNTLTYRGFPLHGNISQHSLKVESYLVNNPNYTFNEHDLSLTYEMQFANTSALVYQAALNQVNLLYPTTFTGATPLPAANYRYFNQSVSYSTDFRKPFNLTLAGGGGQFYNGHSLQLQSELSYRIVPHINLAAAFTYYHLQFPGPYGEAKLFLISPRAEINFSTSLFWTTFLQFNTQGNNFNINSRFQWRFKPMSDLFLVYTDNYFTDPFFRNKNRALILKFQYWLNL